MSPETEKEIKELQQQKAELLTATIHDAYILGMIDKINTKLKFLDPKNSN